MSFPSFPLLSFILLFILFSSHSCLLSLSSSFFLSDKFNSGTIWYSPVPYFLFLLSFPSFPVLCFMLLFSIFFYPFFLFSLFIHLFTELVNSTVAYYRTRPFLILSFPFTFSSYFFSHVLFITFLIFFYPFFFFFLSLFIHLLIGLVNFTVPCYRT